MQWVTALWASAVSAVQNATQGESAPLWLGAGAALVVGGGAAAYIYVNRERRIAEQERLYALELNAPAGRRGEEEANLYAAPVSARWAARRFQFPPLRTHASPRPARQQARSGARTEE